MGNFNAIRDDIATILEGVTGIGQVHKFIRHTTYWEKYIDRHVKNGRVNDWEITRLSMAQDLTSVQNAQGNEPYYHDPHQVLIRGKMGLKDDGAKSTEPDFQDLIDAIVIALRRNAVETVSTITSRLGGKVLFDLRPDVRTIDHISFGGVLCHLAEIEFLATERVGGP